MSQKLLAKLTPYLFMAAVSVLCFFLYIDGYNALYLIPVIVMHIKFQWGLYVYDKKYEPPATPPSDWTKCEYIFFRFI
ncbi:hypothetical protein ACRN9A_19910 [Shewanella frigidimarina]|uniref:hypothetical protein n=1 Tax=Shewanella frigidimarina TaxID=56812 RepID=UPI003D79EFF5